MEAFQRYGVLSLAASGGTAATVRLALASGFSREVVEPRRRCQQSSQGPSHLAPGLLTATTGPHNKVSVCFPLLPSLSILRN